MLNDLNDLVLLKVQVLPSSLMVSLCRSWFWWIQRCRACGQVGDPRLMEDKVEILPLINLIGIGIKINPQIKNNATKYQFKKAILNRPKTRFGCNFWLEGPILTYDQRDWTAFSKIFSGTPHLTICGHIWHICIFGHIWHIWAGIWARQI